MMFLDLDPSRWVPQSYPDIAALRQCGCPEKSMRNPRIDYTTKLFCRNWGPSFLCKCPQKYVNPCGVPAQFRSVRKEVESLDHFTALPLRPEGRYAGSGGLPTLAQQTGLIRKNRNPCVKHELSFSPTCESQGTRLKSDLIKGEATCGTCVPKLPNDAKSTNPFTCDDFPGFNISPNLPFRVCIGEFPPGPPPIRIRSGAERCLQPSNYRDVNSVYRENFTDFMKTKTRKQISLYRSPLAIDKRRPRTVIPVDDHPNLVIGVNNGPLHVNAKYVKFQTRIKKPRPPCLPKKPDFEVFLPGPIVLPY